MTRRKKNAFTIIELMVAIAIMAILTSVVTIAFGATRRNSRDSRRKSDVQTISAGISQYLVVSGTTFIKQAGMACVLPDETNPGTTPNFTTNPGCVGASGRSYGKINLKSGSSQVTSSGYAGNPGRVYAPKSIGQVLQTDGYLTTIYQDPLASTNDVNNPDAPDYVLIRACIVSGKQEVGSRGTVFGVWTSLENGPTPQEQANNNRYPGGLNAGPDTNGGGTYVYDFAAQATEWNSGAYYVNGFAAGNGVTKVATGSDCNAVS